MLESAPHQAEVCHFNTMQAIEYITSVFDLGDVSAISPSAAVRAQDIDVAGRIMRQYDIPFYRANEEPSPLFGDNLYVVDGVGRQKHEERELLAGAVLLPRSTSLEQVMNNAAEPPGYPYVIKDQAKARGTNKILIRDESDHATIERWAHERQVNFMGTVILEEFIEDTSGHAVSYRVNMTPTGTIIASALLHSEGQISPDNGTAVRATRGEWTGLVDPSSKYFIDSPSIVSNFMQGGTIIPLFVKGEYQPSMDAISSASEQILAMHNITDRLLPPSVEQAAREVALRLGPSLALLVGVDLIRDNTGTPLFLEANAGPSLEIIRKCWALDGAGERMRAEDEMILERAYRIFAEDIVA